MMCWGERQDRDGAIFIDNNSEKASREKKKLKQVKALG